MANFNFEYMGDYLQYKDSKGNTLILNGGIINETATGAVAEFTDGADNIPVKSLTVTMEPIQEGTGEPSPENIRPISGRQSVTVTRSGVNVWDEKWEVGVINSDGLPGTSMIDAIRSSNFCSIVGGETYYCTCGKTDGGLQNMYYIGAYFYDADKKFIRRIWANNQTFTAPDNARYFKLSTNSSTVVYGNTYNHDITVNHPSTDHDYHPGTVQSVTLELGQTVYGGTVDVVTGEMVVDRAIIASYNGEPLPGEWISDRDAYAPGVIPTTGAQVCYKLATPITITLTPEQLTTVPGTNNVWSDADSISVDYVADTKLYIQNAISDAVSTI